MLISRFCVAIPLVADIAAYLSSIQLALVGSPAIAHFDIVRSRGSTDSSYIRIRATLVNGDYLEAAEYCMVDGDDVVVVDYRYQWMDASRSTLIRRWDNTPHHPGLAGFPHHVHVGYETNVVPGHSWSLLELLKFLEQELGV